MLWLELDIVALVAGLTSLLTVGFIAVTYFSLYRSICRGLVELDDLCQFRILVLVPFFISIVGCGSNAPLKIEPHLNDKGPWCAPKQRVQIGERVVGKVGWGENKYKNFLVDDEGKEYDTDKIADQCWSYLERTGEARNIEQAFAKDGYLPRMIAVSLKPLVVIVQPRWNTHQLKTAGPKLERYNWTSTIGSACDSEYSAGMQWFSPDLEQKITNLTFSEDGVAEIKLKSGRLSLIHDGKQYKTTRD